MRPGLSRPLLVTKLCVAPPDRIATVPCSAHQTRLRRSMSPAHASRQRRGGGGAAFCLLRGRGNLVSMTSFRKASSAAGRRPPSRRARPGQWQLQEAKARFSEVVRRAKQEGPQHVTVHGREEVVVIGADDFRRLAGERSGKALVDAMRTSPHRSTSIAPPRTRMPVRDVDL